MSFCCHTCSTGLSRPFPSPDVRLCAAVSSQLVRSEVGVVGGGDEVVRQWAPHVLVNLSVLRVEHAVLLRQHVHGETVGGHELVFLGCTGQKAQTQVSKGRGVIIPCRKSQPCSSCLQYLAYLRIKQT